MYNQNRMGERMTQMQFDRSQWRAASCEELGGGFKNSVFGQLQLAVRGKSQLGEFAVGTEISDQWTDVKTGKIYDVPWKIVSYRDILTSSSNHHFAAILLRKCVVPARTDTQEYQYSRRGGLGNVESAAEYAHDTGCSDDIARVAQVIALPGRGGYAKFFAPSAEELHVDVRGMLDDEAIVARQWREYLQEAAWEYFRDTPLDGKVACSKRVFSEPGGTARPYLLRSIPGLKSGAYCNDDLIAQVKTDGSAIAVLPGSAELRNNGTCACLTACAVF